MRLHIKHLTDQALSAYKKLIEILISMCENNLIHGKYIEHLGYSIL